MGLLSIAAVAAAVAGIPTPEDNHGPSPDLTEELELRPLEDAFLAEDDPDYVATEPGDMPYGAYEIKEPTEEDLAPFVAFDAEHEGKPDTFRDRREAAKNLTVIRDVAQFLSEPAIGHHELEGEEDHVDTFAEDWFHIEPHVNESRLDRSRRWSRNYGNDRRIGYIGANSGNEFANGYYYWRVGNNYRYASRNRNSVMGMPAASRAKVSRSISFDIAPGSLETIRVSSNRVSAAWFLRSSAYWLFEVDGNICKDTRHNYWNSKRNTYKDNWYCRTSCQGPWGNWRGYCDRNYRGEQTIPMTTMGEHSVHYYWGNGQYYYNRYRQWNYGYNQNYGGYTYPCNRKMFGAGRHTLTQVVYTRGHCGGPLNGGRRCQWQYRWWRWQWTCSWEENRINRLDSHSRCSAAVGLRSRWSWPPQPGGSGLVYLTYRQCQQGWYRPNRASNCRACEAGKFNTDPLRLGGCNVCPKGKRSIKSSGSTFCVTCPRGTRGGAPPTDKCYDCQPGTYTASANKQVCARCPPGRYTDLPKQYQCKLCNAGYYRNSQMAPTRCEACQKGKYQNNRAQASCKNCPTGTATGKEASIICPSCVPGTVAPTVGMQKCDDCDAGEEQPRPRQTKCISCLAGSYTPKPATPACIACSAADDMYNDQDKSIKCIPQQICDMDRGFLEKKGTITSTSSARICAHCEYGVEYFDKKTEFCAPCRTTCPSGQVIVKPCTLTTNAECGDRMPSVTSAPGPNASVILTDGSVALWPSTSGLNIPASEVMEGIPVFADAPADVCLGGDAVSQTYRNIKARLDEVFQGVRLAVKAIADNLPGTKEPVCPAGQWGLRASGCQACTPACGKGQIMVQGCTDFQDRICETIANCEPDTATAKASHVQMNAVGSLISTAEASQYFMGLGETGGEFKSHTLDLELKLTDVKNSLQQLASGHSCGFDETGVNCDPCAPCGEDELQIGKCDADTNRDCEAAPTLRLDVTGLPRESPKAGTDEGKVFFDSARDGNVFINGETLRGWDHNNGLTHHINMLQSLITSLKEYRDLPVPSPCCAV